MNNEMSTHYRTIIVDDERLARVKLRGLLKNFKQIEIVGEADNVPKAIQLIEKLKVDLLFLDIQMTPESGFDLLEQIEFDGKVVFVTAYDEFALKAFEVNALDYLLKPVREERIELLLKKLEEKTSPDDTLRELDYSDKLFVSNDKLMKFINIKDVVIVEAVGNYTKIFLINKDEILVYKPLKEWESRLPINKFCRIHRAHIINIDYVERFEKWFNYTTKAYMQGVENPLKISKNYASIFKKRFS